jgi:hypothetical protein
MALWATAPAAAVAAAVVNLSIGTAAFFLPYMNSAPAIVNFDDQHHGYATRRTMVTSVVPECPPPPLIADFGRCSRVTRRAYARHTPG